MADIQAVEASIEQAEREIVAATNDEDKVYWRQEKLALRQKELALRQKELALRQKELALLNGTSGECV